MTASVHPKHSVVQRIARSRGLYGNNLLIHGVRSCGKTDLDLNIK